jgi:hypothetical protein
METGVMALLVDRMPCKPSMSGASHLALNVSGTWTPDTLYNQLITRQVEW